MRRTVFFAAVTLVVAAAAAETARTPGVYVSLTTASAAACARTCADDGICMAWSFQSDNRCDLSAVVPGALDSSALAAGFASRAPAYLQPRTPVLHAAEAIELPAASTQIAEVSEDETPRADDELLGGPDADDLRLGLR
jgi:hypothetical protein